MLKYVKCERRKNINTHLFEFLLLQLLNFNVYIFLSKSLSGLIMLDTLVEIPKHGAKPTY
jgi:hypothetical protein